MTLNLLLPIKADHINIAKNVITTEMTLLLFGWLDECNGESEAEIQGRMQSAQGWGLRERYHGGNMMEKSS